MLLDRRKKTVPNHTDFVVKKYALNHAQSDRCRCALKPTSGEGMPSKEVLALKYGLNLIISNLTNPEEDVVNAIGAVALSQFHELFGPK